MLEYELLTTGRLSQALEYLDKLEGVKLLASGTDILVDIKKKSGRLPEFDYLLDISNIDALKFIRQKNDFIELGPLVTHTMIINNRLIKDNFPVIVEAAKTIGSNQIRNRGTIGGNICNASPAADLLPPLLAYRAEVVLESRDSKRVLPLSEFIKGPYRTDLKTNEILTAIQVPNLKVNYFKDNFKDKDRFKENNDIKDNKETNNKPSNSTNIKDDNFKDNFSNNFNDNFDDHFKDYKLNNHLNLKYFSSFQKIGRRRAVTIARLSLALVVGIDAEKIIQDVRVVPGAATPYPRSFITVEEALKGRAVEKIDPEALGRLAAEEMVSITGERWSTPYKKPVIATLVKRGLMIVEKEVAADEED